MAVPYKSYTFLKSYNQVPINYIKSKDIIAYWVKLNEFNDLVSTKIFFNTQDLVTGNIDGQSSYDAEKLKRVLELMSTQSCLIYTYGDSSSDRAILDDATYPHYKIFK